MNEHARTTFDTVGQRARTYAGDANRWGERHLPGGARTLWGLLGVLLVLGLLWVLRPAATTTPTRGFGAGGPMPVGVSKVAAGDINVTFNALGTVTSLATDTVRPQVSGEIVKFDFTEGQMIKAGDVLCEIDPRTYQDALDQAKGQLARDAALLANARIDLKRFQALNAQNAISKQQLDTQAALVQQDKGVVESDNAA